MRKADRMLVDEAARLHPNDWSSLEVRLLDCSKEGFRAHCEARVRPGDLVTLDLPELGPARAQVSWCRDQVLGARFLEPVPIERAGLKSAAQETVLARLLVQRAAAHRGNLRDHEAKLRKQILDALPMRRIAD